MDDPPAVGAHQEGLVDRDRAPSSCATARPTRWSSAGNTGATMAAALLRMGRIKGVARPAIAVPIPVPGQRAADPGRRRRHRRLHRRVARAVRGAWAASTPASASAIDEPRIGLLSNGEEAGKGDELRKAVVPAARRR